MHLPQRTAARLSPTAARIVPLSSILSCCAFILAGSAFFLRASARLVRQVALREKSSITTDTQAAVGDVGLVKGVLVADRDFGFGYKYDLIVENATVTVE